MRTEQYDSLDDMVENVLPYLDFGELVSLSDEELEIAKNKYRIYQLKDDESNRFKRFERLSHQTEPVNIADYQLVYEGSLTEIEGDNKLEQLFIKFNADRPDDFKGHSLSVTIADFLLSKKCFKEDKLCVFVYGIEISISTIMSILLVAFTSIFTFSIIQGFIFLSCFTLFVK